MEPFGGDKTKAETERTVNGIIIINKGIGLPQTTFIDCPVFTGSSLQTTLCCVGRKLPRWWTIYPASELKTVSWIKENSAVCELTGYDPEKITKDKLYGISKKLYEEKSGLENHLSRCTNDLFKLQDKIILYDLTNTYFEGRMKNLQQAKISANPNAPKKICVAHWRKSKKSKIILSVCYGWIAAMWVK